MLNTLIKGFKINAIFTLFSRITGFVRDIFFAYFLGAGIHSDIFFIASKIPNLFRRITAEGALTSSFLPIYSSLLEKKNKACAEEFSKIILFILCISIFLITIFLEFFMEELVLLFAPGFRKNIIIFEDIVFLARFTILFLPFISIVALFGSMLNASGRFAPFAFSPVILNISLIFSCLMITESMSIKAFPLAIALPFSGVIQLIFIFFCLRKYKLISKQYLNFAKIKKENFINFSKNLYLTFSRFIPALFSGGIFQLNILVDTLLASFLGIGAVSFLYYADRLIQLPLGIIGVALGITLLSTLSKTKILKNKLQTAIQLEKALKIGLFFGIPAMLVLLIFPEVIVNSLFKRGNFDFHESDQTILALICYSFGIPFLIISKSCQAVFLASGEVNKIVFVSIFQLLFNIILSIILMQFISHGGIALATSITTFFACFFYFKLIYNEQKIRIGKINSSDEEGLIYLTKYFFQILICSLLMIAFLKLITFFFNYINLEFSIIYVILFSLMGVICYFGITFLTEKIPLELLNNKEKII